MEKDCIIHYEKDDSYDNPVFITSKTQETLLAAKVLHENKNDDHLLRRSIPSSNLLSCKYHRNPCFSEIYKDSQIAQSKKNTAK